MLQTHNLTITHQKDLQELIKDLNLILNPGDKLAIIGEEGTGKSTLIKTLIASDQVSNYVTIDGDIINRFDRIGYLPQSLTPDQMVQTVDNFLYSDTDYSLFDFSLFYKIAERFQLDLDRFEEGKQTLSTLSDKTILFISHDETFLEHTATAILHLELLKKRTTPRASYVHGNYANYRAKRLDTFERQLQQANKEREEHDKKMARHHRLHQSVEHNLRNTRDSAAGRLLAKKMKIMLSQEKKLEQEAENFTEIPQDMDAIKLFFSDIIPLPASKVLLHWTEYKLENGQMVDLLIRGQDNLVIIGQNGIGKTRLLKQILEERRARDDLSLGYMSQNYEDLLSSNQSAIEFLSDVAEPEQSRTLLASLRFTRDEILHSVSDLSGGQKAKLFLAKMVLAGNNVLVLDEPTRHFSPTSQPLIRQLLREFPGAIISVSHDRKYIEEVAEQIYLLDQYQLIETDKKA
ncbi:ABC transporter ATP-binding protein [Streptococcus sp. X16XC17]|uniref:ATP-binding cassette domain-containing protein n=1 Tax=unclassified Streptococcus TaxID=2608887 RepID=UPI00066FE7C8|nr:MULTISPECIES: ATP-binding cassette domain-containing protein [unclassified Streptococcus]TCD46250.1 ABC transporter ATP-binding protein [Streptococcus sp. X16XC17]